MKKKNLGPISFVSLLCVGLILSFNNCDNRVAFDSNPDDGNRILDDGELQDNLDQIEKACADSAHQTQSVSVTFPDPQVTCDFGNNGNLGRLDQYFQARIEQTHNFSLPAGSVICDMQFNFPSQRMLYDDHFMFALDGAIIASSYDFNDKLDKALGIGIYNWGKIVGDEWLSGTSKEGTFCAGMKEGKSTCVWPRTDTPGNIMVDYDSEIFMKVMSIDPNNVNHSFQFVTTGDNDDRDCEHSDVSFSAEVSYVVP